MQINQSKMERILSGLVLCLILLQTAKGLAVEPVYELVRKRSLSGIRVK